jgi:manganese transport protein
VTGTLAANFVREQVAGAGLAGLDPLSGFVLAFAVALAAAMVALLGKFANEELI